MPCGPQMLGEALVDPCGVDGTVQGLGLLPLITRFEREKLLRRTRARFGTLAGEWVALSGVAFDGYEIRHGRTAARPCKTAPGPRRGCCAMLRASRSAGSCTT